MIGCVVNARSDKVTRKNNPIQTNLESTLNKLIRIHEFYKW